MGTFVSHDLCSSYNFLVCAFSVVTGIEMENKYIIKNTMGQQVYFAAERRQRKYISFSRNLLFFFYLESDCYKRQCCGPARPFSMSIMDNTQREVLHMERPLRCQGFCCPCSLQLMEVKGPDNSVLGFIKEK